MASLARAPARAAVRHNAVSFCTRPSGSLCGRTKRRSAAVAQCGYRELAAPPVAMLSCAEGPRYGDQRDADGASLRKRACPTGRIPALRELMGPYGASGQRLLQLPAGSERWARSNLGGAGDDDGLLSRARFAGALAEPQPGSSSSSGGGREISSPTAAHHGGRMSTPGP